MAYGLRVWDASGTLKLDISDRLTRLIGTVTLTVDQMKWYYIDCPATGLTNWIYTATQGTYFEATNVVRTATGIKYYHNSSSPQTLTVNFYGV